MSVLSYCSVVSAGGDELLSALRALHAQRFHRRVYRDPNAFAASTSIAQVSIRSVFTDAGLETLEALLGQRIADEQRDGG
jgi:hypothetical protein